MTNEPTSQSISVERREPALATGPWVTDQLLVPGPSSAPTIAFGRLVACGVLLTVSTLTSAHDPWFERDRDRSQATTAAVFRPVSGRRISAVQAHQIALRNLHKAEAERRSLAKEEARRGINWEEIS